MYAAIRRLRDLDEAGKRRHTRHALTIRPSRHVPHHAERASRDHVCRIVGRTTGTRTSPGIAQRAGRGRNVFGSHLRRRQSRARPRGPRPPAADRHGAVAADSQESPGRNVPDVAYNAGVGMAVYDTFGPDTAGSAIGGGTRRGSAAMGCARGTLPIKGGPQPAWERSTVLHRR